MKRDLKQEGLITRTKQIFESELINQLQLTKINAPLFVESASGLNDNLNGVERPVLFELKGVEYQIVHSLAKWKRWCLGRMKAQVGEGIVTDMKAIRADESLSAIHSHLVDQWDWERVISREERTIESMISYGESVYKALKSTQEKISEQGEKTTLLPNSLKVIHTEELFQKYPEYSPKEREHKIAKEFGAVLLLGIGGKLSNGEVHDLRAPDYDDWITESKNGFLGLNGDLIVWDEARKESLEISSMGIRVDEKSMELQLKEMNQLSRKELPFHKSILNKELPYTVGGGIGQSRVVMFLTQTKKISDVQPILN